MSDIINSAANAVNYKYSSNLGWFQIGGAASGLDTASIVDKILELESKPLQDLNLKFEKIQLKRNAFDEVKSKLQELRDMVFDLKLRSNMMLKKASSSNENILEASASTTAAEGNYFVKVLNLATSSTLESADVMTNPGIASSTALSDLTYYTSPQDSTIRIYKKVGDTIDYSNVDISTSDTIQDVVDKINTALDNLFGSGAGISSYDESTGKLTIKIDPSVAGSDAIFSITELSGNFLDVFHLNEIYLEGTEVTSNAPVWSVNENKTLQNIADYLGKNISDGSIIINGTEIEVNSSDTIETLILRINGSDAGVFAYYDYHMNKMVLTSKETGNTSITVDDNGTGVAQLLGLVSNDNGDPYFTPGQSAHIQVSVDGVNYFDVYSDSNTGIEFEGITFDVNDVSDTPIIVQVRKDSEEIKEKLQEFIDKWNEVVGYIYDKLHEEPVKDKSWDEMSDDEKMQGILKGDSYLQSLFERLKRFMFNSFASEGDYHYLFEIGISSGDVGSSYENTLKGHIEIDEDKLDDIINNHFEELWNFLGASDDSFFPSLHDFLWDVTKFGGEIDSVAGTNGSLWREQRFLAQRIEDWVMRLNKRKEELWRNFSYMEDVISRLQAQSAWLANATANKK
ncbi:MAG: flagellar filament capping protein FliD [Thermotogaceae bacterium]|nr:flagellar filament capping protein FliD [Thermotogaceae bacterium]